MKLQILLTLLLLTSCASFTKTAAIARTNVIFNHLIYKDSVFNKEKLKDSLRTLKDKRIKKLMKRK